MHREGELKGVGAGGTVESHRCIFDFIRTSPTRPVPRPCQSPVFRSRLHNAVCVYMCAPVCVYMWRVRVRVPRVC